jgi:hypothetical protein
LWQHFFAYGLLCKNMLKLIYWYCREIYDNFRYATFILQLQSIHKLSPKISGSRKYWFCKKVVLHLMGMLLFLFILLVCLSFFRKVFQIGSFVLVLCESGHNQYHAHAFQVIFHWSCCTTLYSLSYWQHL